MYLHPNPNYHSHPNHILNSNPDPKSNFNTDPNVLGWRCVGGYFTHRSNEMYKDNYLSRTTLTSTSCFKRKTLSAALMDDLS